MKKGLQRFGLTQQLLICRFLEGIGLHSAGRSDEALPELESLLTESELVKDRLVYGLVLVNIGQIRAKKGDTSEAFAVLAQARVVIEGSGNRWALANYYNVYAEVLRDLEQYESAIESYGIGVDLLSSMQMESQAAYVRVVLAETMLLAGREDEAQVQIVRALPVISREALLPDATAAIALLRESIRRQKADPEALRTLKLELQKMREGNQS